MFICNTSSCAISISKAEFPVAMPCPVCQTMLSAEVSANEDELALLQNLPYVIVYPLKKNIRRKHAEMQSSICIYTDQWIIMI